MLKILIFISLFFIHFISAQTLEVTDSKTYKTKNFINYTLAHELNETIAQLNNRKWTRDKNSFNSLEYADHAYWAKIKIRNITNFNKTYYLKSENQFTYKIDYYLVKNTDVLKHIADGVTSKNCNRAFNTSHMIFPLQIEANSEVEVYFKIRNYNKINIVFTLVTQDYLLNYYQTYNILEGIFFGGMLLLMLYNLFLYFLLQVRAYLYYVAYVFSVSIYFIGIFGFSQRYFESYTYIFYLSSGAFFVFLTLFVQSILNLKEKLSHVYKVLNLFIFYFIIATLSNIYALEIKSFTSAQILFNINFILVSIFVLIIISSTYYLAYVKNDIIAKFYSFIWSAIALIGLSLPLQYLNIISIDIPADYIFQFLILLEVLFFSFILAYKINLVEREKKEQERIMVQQNKLASMGEVVAMIAHQWRQPLSEINGIILNMDIDHQKQQLPSNKFNQYLDNIEITTAYMSKTINDFLDYFKHNKKVEEFSVSNLIEGTLNLVSSINNKHINIEYIKHPEIILSAYKSELTQALLIILNNALDACSEVDIPHITIFIEVENKDIIISVKDNGIGISPKILDKIYEPYFTTKHESKGTGLGLYILKMIIEESMQGRVELKSHKNTTVCNLYIPNIVIE
ncbi:MAG TPA: GHKL domain-containing protein [Campylobacterales bacterium]|nr:GHKL domain-containing protein [Campylobacterales bacterium]